MKQTIKNFLVDFFQEEQAGVKVATLAAVGHLLSGIATGAQSAAKIVFVLYTRRAEALDAPYKKPEPEIVFDKESLN